MAIELTTISDSNRTALQAAIEGAEEITTGASPVAADPEVGVTYITSGGTMGTESITLGLPSNPAEKIGKTKRFVLRTKTDDADVLNLDLTNVLSTFGDPETGNLFGAVFLRQNHAWCELVLVYGSELDEPQFVWQFVRATEGGLAYTLGAYFLPSSSEFGTAAILKGGAATGSGEQGGPAQLVGAPGDIGGEVRMLGGVGVTAEGGHVKLTPGNGATDGGDVIVTLPAAGSGRNGQLLLNGYPTEDPLMAGSVWCDVSADFVLKVSQGS